MAYLHEHGMVVTNTALEHNSFWKALLILFAITFIPGVAKPPFSKVVITSDRATCERDTTNPDMFFFTYEKNVHVRLADEMVIRAESLEIHFQGSLLHGKKSLGPQEKNEILNSLSPTPTLHHFKRIVFKGAVHLTKENRTARADAVEVYPEKNQCLLKGNVVIKQYKNHTKSFPLISRSHEALIDLKTYRVVLEGTATAPVSTVIMVGENNASSKEPIIHEKNQSTFSARSPKNCSR